jgi:hypothetical protein
MAERKKSTTWRLESWLEKIKPWHTLAGLIASIIGAVLFAKAWVETTARNAVSNEKTLKDLAARIRPTCFFDSHGTIDTDLGAMAYLNGPLILTKKGEGFEVHIPLKEHLGNAPLLTATDTALFQQSAIRTNSADWIIDMQPPKSETVLMAVDTGQPPPTNLVYHFKLEILH